MRKDSMWEGRQNVEGGGEAVNLMKLLCYGGRYCFISACVAPTIAEITASEWIFEIIMDRQIY